eukprot:CAMPEP_0197635716 /NCGR_PEP_ID=MMETSP1338-20131121/11456_1 /TAXON_ID=43686 ORGANISM="Pelagodinium beii, Strain RCC1491" /NCGR_SAMPLE_ID=MMETSP1338 /ASSEMBLY_ACC=CAM_ASM_000754 /LENGTH=492 /DNA_ID=CAMNT_0043207835 /DNA_START=6 /DNA_END=1484 /DNA_ORIENTATION=+
MRRTLLEPIESSKEAAQKVMDRRRKLSRRWMAELSSFTALNLDAARSLPLGSASVVLENGGRISWEPASMNSTASTASGDGAVTTDSCETEKEDSSSQLSLTEDESILSQNLDDFVKVRQSLLQFRELVGHKTPPEMKGYKITAVSKNHFVRQQSEPVPVIENKSFGFQRQMTEYNDRTTRKSVLPPSSPNAYRIGKSAGPADDMKRQVQGLLNKICPENVALIVEQIAAIEVQDITQLQAIIELMFKKAITEPHYCETYADLVFSLKAVYPAFPDPDGGKPVTLKGLVLNICQNEFEDLLASADLSKEEIAGCDEEELEHLRKKRKDRMRANMKFIGHLFLRQLLSAKVIGTIICELVLCEQEDLPEEHALECACELLLAVGYTLENMAAGETALIAVCARLKDLKSSKSNGKAVYCKRVQFMIQDILETRARGWTKKVFQAAAKTKEEIRLDQERELSDKARGRSGSMQAEVSTIVTGQRPAYLSSVTGA